MATISITIRTADRTRKAQIDLSDDQTCADVIEAAKSNWSLPGDTDYSLVNTDRTPPQTLVPTSSLNRSGVTTGTTLEIQPVLVAGAQSHE